MVFFGVLLQSQTIGTRLKRQNEHTEKTKFSPRQRFNSSCYNSRLADNRLYTAKNQTERCPSGRRSTPGKCVYGKTVPRVRIPLSPPLTGYVMVARSVPSQCDVVNPVRSGRKQRQQRIRVPGCSWPMPPPALSSLSPFSSFST
jgi:hypothetical protein